MPIDDRFASRTSNPEPFNPSEKDSVRPLKPAFEAILSNPNNCLKLLVILAKDSLWSVSIALFIESINSSRATFSSLYFSPVKAKLPLSSVFPREFNFSTASAYS